MTISPKAEERILTKGRLSGLDGKSSPDFDSNDGIDILDIADGLKELLRRNKLTFDTLVSLAPSELADIVGIDGYVAKIICDCAKKNVSL
ncbi:MAG: hypothetical protein M3297_04040 [Thermoproteota archaeon]|nr:hypothetical protein [Thermoproteota archaeon]